MKTEKQVTSFEISKRIKELGVVSKSILAWDEDGKLTSGYFGSPQPEEYNKYDNRVSAFTVAELGEMLPTRIDAKSKKDSRRHISYFLTYEAGGCAAYYAHHMDIYQVLCNVSDDTEADTRGKMLIYLLENKLITL